MEPLCEEYVVYQVLDHTLLRDPHTKPSSWDLEYELGETLNLCIGETLNEQDAETQKKCFLTPEDTHAAAGGKYIRVIGGQGFHKTFVLGPNFFKHYLKKNYHGITKWPERGG